MLARAPPPLAAARPARRAVARPRRAVATCALAFMAGASAATTKAAAATTPAADAPAYYLRAHFLMVAALLLLATHTSSVLYLRWSLSSDQEEARDGVPFQLCAAAQSVAWIRLLLLLSRVSNLAVYDAAAAAAAASALLAVAAASQWVLTPFAYLYHEAVGMGHFWGAYGIAGRATEAAALLGLIAILAQGLLSVLGALLEAPAGPEEGGAPQTSRTLQHVLSHAGLAFLLVTIPRGALALAVTRSRSSSTSQPAGLMPLPLGQPAAAVGRIGEGGASAFEVDDDDDDGSGGGGGAAGGTSAPHGARPPPLDPSAGPAAAGGDAAARGVDPSAHHSCDPSVSPDSTVSLLAQPLPTRRVLLLAQARALPSRALRVAAAAMWLWLLLAVLLRLGSLLGGGWDADASGQSASAGRLGGSWLALHLVASAAGGHHLVCHHRLLERKRRVPSLQSSLLQVAALQVSTDAVPVAAHALGLVPRALAAAHTSLPLCSTPLHAAAVCVAFLCANALAAAREGWAFWWWPPSRTASPTLRRKTSTEGILPPEPPTAEAPAAART